MPRVLLRLAVPAMAAGLLAACGDDTEVTETTPPPVREPEEPTPPTEPPPPTLPDTETIAGVEVGLEPVATLDTPLALAWRPGVDDRALVAERDGVVQEVRLDDGTTTPAVNIAAEVSTASEQGLLGLAFSPEGDRLYLSYTDPNGDTRVDELGYDAGGADLDSRRNVLALGQPFANHNGGQIAFGPDGLLYLGLGDGGGGSDPLDAGQDPSTLLGSILRIDPEGVDGSAYSVPADNPFVGQDGARPETWLIGVRNPWRFSFDRRTGDLWVADVGQDAVEEINWLPAHEDGLDAGRGANLGWSLMEGDQPFGGSPGPPENDYVGPVHTYPNPDEGCSVTGGYVYRGEAVPDLVGAYVYADYCVSEVRALLLRDGEVVEDRALGPAVQPRTLASFGQGPDGELYVLSMAGEMSRIAPAS